MPTITRKTQSDKTSSKNTLETLNIKSSLWYKRHKEKQSFKTTINCQNFITHPIISIANKNSDPNINKEKLNGIDIDTPKGEELNEIQLDCVYLSKNRDPSFHKKSAQSVREKIFPNSKCARRSSTFHGYLLTPTHLNKAIVPITPFYKSNEQIKKISDSNSAKKNSKIENTKTIDLSNYKILI